MTSDSIGNAREFLKRVLPAEAEGDGLESLTTAADPVNAVMPQGVVPEEHQDTVRRTAEKLADDAPLTDEEHFVLEAIIIPDKRPAVTIRGGDYSVDHPMWQHLNGAAAKQVLKKAIPSIGRIELPGHPTTPYGGTGFVVGEGLIMTNRHVAEIFCSGLGQRGLTFSAGQKAGVDFLKEADSSASLPLEVRGIVMIHPYWDMALLKVEGLPAGVRPLTLSSAPPQGGYGRDVAVIGYPAFDRRNRADVQNQVFGGVYDVKRLMPGKLTGGGPIRSFGKDVPASLHDSSTLGGASGSAVIDVLSGEVLALHFAGIYLKTNYGVPAADLARDPRVVAAGLNFAAGAPAAGPGPWDEWWRIAEATESTSVQVPANLPNSGGGVSLQSPAGSGSAARWTIPIEISIDLGAPQHVSAAAAPARAETAAEDVTEKAVEPWHEESYDNRKGYDPEFLGLEVLLPQVTDESVLALLADGASVIPYHHFSLTMHRERRLAIFTAANVDNSPQRRKPDAAQAYGRKALSGLGDTDMERWFPDPRLRGLDQLPDRFFDKDKKAFDKGHLVRRDDVAWGNTYEELRAANGDTYHTTNCSPQVGDYNRSNLKGIWGLFENELLKQAAAERLSYFAGPVLRDSDRRFAGVDDTGKVKVQIPEEYWKVVLSVKDGELRAHALVLRQDLSGTPLEFTVDENWARHMVSIAELEEMLGIVRFPEIVHRGDQHRRD